MQPMKTLGIYKQLAYKTPNDDFMIKDGYLFKSTRLCFPKSGTRQLLVREVHSGSLAGNYGENKMLSML